MAKLAKILLLLLAATQVLAEPSRPRIRGHGTKKDSPDHNEPVTLPGEAQDDKGQTKPMKKNLIRPHLARPHQVKPEGASFDQNEQTTCIEEAVTAPPPTTCVTESANPPAPPHTDQPVTGQQFGRITHEKSIKIIIRKKGHSHGPPSPPDTPKPPHPPGPPTPPVPPMPPTPPVPPMPPTNTTTTTTPTTPTTHKPEPEPTTTATPPYTPLTTCIIVTTEKLMNMKECLEQARQEIKKDPIQQIGASQSQHQNQPHQPQRLDGNPNANQQYQQHQGPGQHPSPIQGANHPQPHPHPNSKPAQIPPQIKPLPYHRPIQKTGGAGYLNEGNEDYETHYVYEELPGPAASQQESGLGDIVATPLVAPADDNAGVGGVANYLYDAGGGFWNQRQ